MSSIKQVTVQVQIAAALSCETVSVHIKHSTLKFSILL